MQVAVPSQITRATEIRERELELRLGRPAEGELRHLQPRLLSPRAILLVKIVRGTRDRCRLGIG